MSPNNGAKPCIKKKVKYSRFGGHFLNLSLDPNIELSSPKHRLLSVARPKGRHVGLKKVWPKYGDLCDFASGKQTYSYWKWWFIVDLPIENSDLNIEYWWFITGKGYTDIPESILITWLQSYIPALK